MEITARIEVPAGIFSWGTLFFLFLGKPRGTLFFVNQLLEK
jgi:hypothetical protein